MGLNYLQGEENPTFDLRTEDRIGLTLSTQISDRILINGKIGVPIDGVEQSVIVGDVQIDFILNESGSLKAKYSIVKMIFVIWETNLATHKGWGCPIK